MYYTIQAANNKDTDQTTRMRRLICAFVVRIWNKQVFSWRGSYIKWSIYPNKDIFSVNPLIFSIILHVTEQDI